MRDARAAPSVRRFPLDGGLLLLDASSGSLFAFNDAARHVWDLIVAGRSGDVLISEYAGWWGISASRAQDDVSAILDQWHEFGLLDGGARAEAPPRPAAAAAAGVHEPRRVSEWTCTIRGTAIRFAVENGAAPTVRPLFAHLETPDARPQARLEIRTASGGGMLLVQDGVERIRTDDSGLLAGALQQAVLERIHGDVAWLALMHGAALARDGGGIGLAGPSGSGKSTLAAGLLQAGYDYMADDMIALSAPDGAIMPWPMPLSIKPGSLDVVAARYPELARAPRYRTKDLEARLLVPGEHAWNSVPAKLRTLVFPRFAAGATGDLRRISTFEAVERLLADRIWLGYPLTEARVAAFVTWLMDIPTYAVTYGELDDGVRLIESMRE
ncbi:MAG: PqqD family peptide modification chaperone [Pseudomonadota bacterium]